MHILVLIYIEKCFQVPIFCPDDSYKITFLRKCGGHSFLKILCIIRKIHNVLVSTDIKLNKNY